MEPIPDPTPTGSDHPAQPAPPRNVPSDREDDYAGEILASITDFFVCLDREFRVLALNPAAVQDLRRATAEVCQSQGLSEERCHDLITAVSEAGMNAAVHAGEGEGQVFVGAQNGVVQVRVADRGPGISLEHLPHATLRKGFTTARTLGHGMKMMIQTSDRIYLRTGPNGTTVVIEQERVARPPSW
jgi:anti-sigma regulatory factor (Ser/Thr protein kinase)